MNIITKIIHNAGKNNNRVYVYIDNEYCASIRERTWPYFQLCVGNTISQEELKTKEKFIWKYIYKHTWKHEKIRLEHICRWLLNYIPMAKPRIVGFGAGSTDFIEEHPTESGSPDIEVTVDGHIILYIEVTGTEYKRGTDYWVRPDKVTYIQKHYGNDIWIALHYADTNQIIWLRIDQHKKYKHEEKLIGEVIEYYIIFDDTSPEVKTSQFFKEYIDNKILSYLNNN